MGHERELEHLHEAGCCCEFNPSIEDSYELGVRLVSNCCPIHNFRPLDREDCGCIGDICPYEKRGKALNKK